MAERSTEKMTEWLDIHVDTLSVEERGTHLRRDTVIPQWFQASKAAAASDGHAVHC